jgi:phosphatidylglycerol lysyltransferase
VGGVVFLASPPEVSPGSLIALVPIRLVGAALLALLGGYLLWSLLRKKPVSVRGWEFPVPPIRLSLTQIGVSCLDWTLAGCALYVLLPPAPNLTFFGFLSIYLFAQMAGMVSQVPGGLGVFEGAVVLLLPKELPTSSVVASLLAYRATYYLLPLCIAGLLLGAYEVLERKEGTRCIARAFGQWVPEVAPRVLAVTTFVGGTVLLVSGATPAISGRLSWVRDFLPLPVIEISHFLGSLAGTGLLLLARGLQRRLDAAYLLTAILLASGMLASLLKGFDFEEAIILGIMLGMLLPCRKYFYRRSSLLAEPFTPGWVVAILLVFSGTLWLGLFSYKHVEYSNDLWWRFAWHGGASRFLRAAVGSLCLTLFIAIARLLRPAWPRIVSPDAAETDRVRALVQASRRTVANLALLGDKRFLFSESGKGFIMYGVEGRSWVAMGDPVAPQGEVVELAWRFLQLCDRHGGWTVFYEVATENLTVYLDMGLTLLKIGEEARVRLETFSLEGGDRKELRHVRNRLEKEGCSFEVIPAEGTEDVLMELKRISDAWLEDRNTREKGFSLGFFDPVYIKRYPIALVRREGKIVAFTNLWQGADKDELSMDLMRYSSEAPDSVMDYLIVRLILWGRDQGYHWFSLGMAPLSGLESHPGLAPLWSRIGAFVHRHGEHFYNFQGLRRYKDKFDPEWEPRYLAIPGGLKLPRVFTNIASLISGGMKGVIAK